MMMQTSLTPDPQAFQESWERSEEEALDPTTSPERLRQLAFFFSIKVAQNPNADLATLEDLSKEYPPIGLLPPGAGADHLERVRWGLGIHWAILGENPLIPLLLLEDPAHPVVTRIQWNFAYTRYVWAVHRVEDRLIYPWLFWMVSRWLPWLSENVSRVAYESAFAITRGIWQYATKQIRQDEFDRRYAESILRCQVKDRFCLPQSRTLHDLSESIYHASRITRTTHHRDTRSALAFLQEADKTLDPQRPSAPIGYASLYTWYAQTASWIEAFVDDLSFQQAFFDECQSFFARPLLDVAHVGRKRRTR